MNVRSRLRCSFLLATWFEQCPYHRRVAGRVRLDLACELVNLAIAWHLNRVDDSELFGRLVRPAFRTTWMIHLRNQPFLADKRFPHHRHNHLDRRVCSACTRAAVTLAAVVALLASLCLRSPISLIEHYSLLRHTRLRQAGARRNLLPPHGWPGSCWSPAFLPTPAATTIFIPEFPRRLERPCCSSPSR